MKQSWSPRNKTSDPCPLSLTDDSETLDYATFVETLENSTFVDTLENYTSTDWSNNQDAVTSDISYDYDVSEDNLVSCSSIVDEFKILCSSSVDHNQSIYDLDDIWQILESTQDFNGKSQQESEWRTISHPILKYIVELDKDESNYLPLDEKIELVLSEKDVPHLVEKDESLEIVFVQLPSLLSDSDKPRDKNKPFVKNRFKRLAKWSKMRLKSLLRRF